MILLGTDTNGRVFSEETTTLVLSRHGAGIISRYKLAPDEILTLRRVGFNPEAEARLVGQMGQQGNEYVYGVEFNDPDVNFWQIEFPPPRNSSDSPAGFALECSLCGARGIVQQSEIEADVYAVNDSILRYCTVCGLSTSWRKAKPGVPPAPPASILTLDSERINPPAASSKIAGTESGAQPQRGVAAAVLEKPATEMQPGSSAVRTPDKGKNRRRHVRAAVNFTACVRHGVSGEEIVECINISRGGASFYSSKKYEQGALIEIAAPYSPGSPAIFVYATIRHVKELPDVRFRYGMEYIKHG